jgi:hypothetical protein
VKTSATFRDIRSTLGFNGLNVRRVMTDVETAKKIMEQHAEIERIYAMLTKLRKAQDDAPRRRVPNHLR